MSSEHGDHGIMDDSDEEMIVYQASDMGSSASIEALPSIDYLENQTGLYNYGAINEENVQNDPSAEELTMNIGICETDNETAPLIPVMHQDRDRSPPVPQSSYDADESREKLKPHEPRAFIASLLLFAIAEVPTFIIIIQGREQIFSLLGMKRYNIVITSLIVVTSIMNHYGREEKVVAFRQSGNDTTVTRLGVVH